MSQLLTRRPHPSLDEAMPELRAEDRLRAGTGSQDQQAASIHTARVPTPVPAPSTVTVSPPPSTSPVIAAATSSASSSSFECGYCGRRGHDASVCRKRQRDRARRGGRSSHTLREGSTQQGPHSLSAAEQEALALFRRLTLSAHAHGTAASASSSTPPPPGISSHWFLNSGASFHMTHDSTHLSSVFS